MLKTRVTTQLNDRWILVFVLRITDNDVIINIIAQVKLVFRLQTVTFYDILRIQSYNNRHICLQQGRSNYFEALLRIWTNSNTHTHMRLFSSSSMIWETIPKRKLYCFLDKRRFVKRQFESRSISFTREMMFLFHHAVQRA